MKLSRAAKWISAVLVPLLWLGLFLFWRLFQLPTDHQLRDFFTEHKSTFTSLESMLDEDRSIRRIVQGQFAIHKANDSVSDILTHPAGESGLSSDRIAQYNRLLSQLGIKSLWSDGNGTTTLLIGGWGFAGYGPRWGYSRLPNPPPAGETLASFDDF